MAEYHVTTASDFLNRLGGASSDTIYIDSDIDFNSITSWTTKTITTGTIEGNGHTLYNIQCANDNVFTMNAGFTRMNNTIFANVLHLGSNALFRANANTVSTRFENCQFSGKFHLLSSGGIMNFNKCFFDLLQYYRIATTSSGLREHFNECYFDLHNHVIESGNDLSYCDVANCYFKGTIEISSGNLIAGTTESYNNIYNIDFSGAVGSITIPNKTGAENTSLYNATKSQLTVNGITGLSDSDLKNATAIRNTGFPIAT